MKFPFFASFIVFCGWLSYEIHKHRNMENNSMEEFWKKEEEANNTRRKSLDGLSYITIPFESLPMDLLADDPVIREYHETLHALAEGPIVNLTGISNTDLKLTYGAPNIKLLSLYDQRYTTLVRTLQNLGEALYEHGYSKEARTVLEFAVSTHTDISATYRLLSVIYTKDGQSDKIKDLLPIAEALNSVLKNSIVRMLNDIIDQTAE